MTTLGAPWAHFWNQKKAWSTKGAPRVPKRRQPQILVTLLETLWSYFLEIFSFFAKKHGSEIRPFFSSICGSPCALQGMGSYAIRTRRRSPNPFFRFHISSQKELPKDIILGPFWMPFSFKIAILSEKVASKNGSKKGCPPIRKQVTIRGYDQAPRLPDSPPRVRGFLNKKQLSEQETETAAHF